MSSDLEPKFKKAVWLIRNGPPAEGATTETKLLYYAHYKQATEGDVTGSQPWRAQFEARAKWDAWAKLKGMSREEAMQKYIDLISKCTRPLERVRQMHLGWKSWRCDDSKMQQTPALPFMQPDPTGRTTLLSRTTRRSRPPAFPDKTRVTLPHTAPMERLTFLECLESRPHQAFGNPGWLPRPSAAGWGERRGGARLTWTVPVWRWFSCSPAPKQIVDPVETSMVSRA